MTPLAKDGTAMVTPIRVSLLLASETTPLMVASCAIISNGDRKKKDTIQNKKQVCFFNRELYMTQN
jgi:hypothetical protein